MRIKHSHQKITMTHTQTTCPNRITLHAGKKGTHPAEPWPQFSKNQQQSSNQKKKKKKKITKMQKHKINSDIQH